MIDFNEGQEKFSKFLGSERKTAVLYENQLYMIKYPDPVRDKKNVLSYMNNQYSEHIGCSIFRACGFETQETMLGYFKDTKGVKKIVVGCKDFTQDGWTLHEFSTLANQVLTDGNRSTTIENVNTVITQSNLIVNKTDIMNRFWNMFVIDTLLANPDRHYDNWGILAKNGEVKFAPIYDCGSALSALLDNKVMEELLINPTSFKNEEYNVASCYSMKGKRIFYHEIYKNPPDELLKAVERTVPLIDMERTRGVIDSVERMPDIRKEYLKKAVNLRYERILLPCLTKVLAHVTGRGEKPSVIAAIRNAEVTRSAEPAPPGKNVKRKSAPEL